MRHCRKTSHSRTKENRLVIQIPRHFGENERTLIKALFIRNKELDASKEVEENALASEGKSISVS